MLRSLVGSEMCIRDRYQRRVHGGIFMSSYQFSLVIIAVLLVSTCASNERAEDISTNLRRNYRVLQTNTSSNTSTNASNGNTNATSNTNTTSAVNATNTTSNTTTTTNQTQTQTGAKGPTLTDFKKNNYSTISVDNTPTTDFIKANETKYLLYTVSGFNSQENMLALLYIGQAPLSNQGDLKIEVYFQAKNGSTSTVLLSQTTSSGVNYSEKLRDGDYMIAISNPSTTSLLYFARLSKNLNSNYKFISGNTLVTEDFSDAGYMQYELYVYNNGSTNKTLILFQSCIGQNNWYFMSSADKSYFENRNYYRYIVNADYLERNLATGTYYIVVERNPAKSTAPGPKNANYRLQTVTYAGTFTYPGSLFYLDSDDIEYSLNDPTPTGQEMDVSWKPVKQIGNSLGNVTIDYKFIASDSFSRVQLVLECPVVQTAYAGKEVIQVSSTPSLSKIAFPASNSYFVGVVATIRLPSTSPYPTTLLKSYTPFQFKSPVIPPDPEKDSTWNNVFIALDVILFIIILVLGYFYYREYKSSRGDDYQGVAQKDTRSPASAPKIPRGQRYRA
eukprot:TRINITY_DN2894_c0_g2_i5.p1 TRINITY_DN2894_c0_g2~~TRINITY_DN2894_c0_g2_i5.p1  ORF type:complete len:559 (+),score=87.80 TRINITY_DN2894_c0_g2_i5:73-1749(+)